MIKEIPILFTTDMVQAILAGRKTITRRIVKLPDCDYPSDWATSGKVVGCVCTFLNDTWGKEVDVKCRYGKPGDLLYVRETFVYRSKHDRYYYKADHQQFEPYAHSGWKPSIHMPKEAARIWLKVTNVRVEQLHDITESDAIAEGVKRNCDGDFKNCPACSNKSKCAGNDEWFHYMRCFDDFPAYSAVESFLSLWEKINGTESLKSNPWVWVVSFRLISTTGKQNF